MTDIVNTAEIRVVADASGVEAGLRPAVDAAQRAERAISNIGSGSARSQQNLIQSIQRTTAEMEAGSRTGARYFEVLAQQRGIDPGVLQPYLQQLRAVQEAQQGAGQSAGQTANALRQVPAQLTDIVTSLQGGMEPLTVLIQQGGQLRDSFGGIGPAARAMGGQILALANPFTITAAAVAVLSAAYYEGSQEADRYRNSLIMSGNAIGLSTGQVADMAQAIGKASGTQKGAVEALVAMVDAGNIPAERLQQFASVAIGLQKTLGTSVADTAQEFAELGEKPVEAAEKLNAKYHYLTAAVYEQIRALEEQGKTEEAGALAQDAYAAAMDVRSKKIVANLGYIESRWKELGEFASKAWDKMLGVGRSDTIQDELNGLLAKQARMQKNIADFQAGRDTWGEWSEKGRLASIEAEIAAKRGLLEADKAAAKAEADRVAQDEKKIKVSKEFAAISDRISGVHRQYQDDLKKLQAAREQEIITEKEYISLVSKLAAEEYKRSGGSKADADAAKKRADALKKEAELLSELSGLNATFAADWEILTGLYRKGKLSVDQLAEAQANLLSKQTGLKKMTDEIAKEMADYAKATASAADVMEKELEAITKQVQATKDHNEQIGLSTKQIAELEGQRLESMANRLEENAIIAEGLDLTGDKAEGLRKEAAAYRELASAKREGAVRQVAADGAKKTAEDWKKAADDIEKSLTDALLRGFESGKGFGQNLVDTIKNMFNTLVLRPIVSAIVNPVAGAITGGMGLTGAAQAAGSAASGASALGNAGGLLGGIGAASSAFGTGIASGLSAWGAEGSVMGLLNSGALFGGGIANGLGAIAGALGPIALGIGAAVMIWKKLDTSGTYHAGGAASATSAGVTAISAGSLNMERIQSNSATQQMVGELASGVVSILDSTALAFGKTAGYQAATAFADDTSKDGAWGSLVISKMGQSLVNWQDTRGNGKWSQKTFADGDKGQEQYLAALTSSVRIALDTIGLPEWARTMLNGVASDASLDDLAKVVDQINKTQAALGAMRSQLTGFSSLSETAVSALMAASGGIDKLFASASVYYDAFYTEAEKNSTVNGQIAKQLAAVNLAMPATREGFRALVEAQMKLGTQGAESVSVLLGVAGAFAQLHPEVEAVTKDLAAQRSALTEAYNAESSALQEATGRAGSFAKSLRDLSKNALLGSLSPLSPQQKLAEARSQYEATVAAARSGDQGAQDRYQDVYTAFLEASRAVNASGAGYQQDFSYAQAMTEEVARWAGEQVDVGQAQLDSLKASVSGIIDVNKSVLSVRDALLQYHEAMGKNAMPLTAVAPPVNTPIPYSSYGTSNTEALVAEVKALRTEVSGLRADARQQTGEVIQAQYGAADESSDKIADSVRPAKSLEYRVAPA
jgi:phage-related minor tail protein